MQSIGWRNRFLGIYSCSPDKFQDTISAQSIEDLYVQEKNAKSFGMNTKKPFKNMMI
jgi:hypothetical protein